MTLTCRPSNARPPSLNRANLNVKASRGLYREMAGMLFEHYGSSTIAGHTIGVSWNPLTPHVVRETNRKGGVAGGWQEVNQNCESASFSFLILNCFVFSFFWAREAAHSPAKRLKHLADHGAAINLRVNWDDAADDAAAIRMDDAFMEKIAQAARRWDALMPNQWANNAAEHVDVMRSYGDVDFDKLRQVSLRYDANQTFQRLCSGGYKLW